MSQSSPKFKLSPDLEGAKNSTLMHLDQTWIASVLEPKQLIHSTEAKAAVNFSQ